MLVALMTKHSHLSFSLTLTQLEFLHHPSRLGDQLDSLGQSFAWRQSNKIFRMGSKKFFGLSCFFPAWSFAPLFGPPASSSLAPKQVHAQAAQDARVAIFANLMAHLIADDVRS